MSSEGPIPVQCGICYRCFDENGQNRKKSAEKGALTIVSCEDEVGCQRRVRMRVTRDQIARLREAFLAQEAEKRPLYVPEWAWEAERAGILSILADLSVELEDLRQEEWKHQGIQPRSL
jgi:hypothetical protein